MIQEIADIEVHPGREAAFEQAVQQALPHFRSSPGCRALSLQREIERPNHYALWITWDTVEDHTVGFRGSQNFVAWRALVEGLLASPPVVRHVQKVFDGF